MSSQTGISVAIANWNGGDHVVKCLDSLFAQSQQPDEVIVVDNGSTDGSPLQIRVQHPQVRLLTRPQNEGFCAGYNRAIRATRSEYVLILNNDVTLDPEFLVNAKRYLDIREDVGWLAARVRTEGLGDLQGSYLSRHVGLSSERSLADEAPVFAGSGAVIFCRRSMLDDIAYEGEYYDESFFAYIEDVDLAWRANLRGWHCAFRDNLRCSHIGSASQAKRIRSIDKSRFFLSHILKNRFLTLVKNATPGVMLRFLPALVVGELYIAIRLLASPSRFRAIPTAISWATKSTLVTLRKRRRIMRRRLVSDTEILNLTRGW